MYPIRDFRSLLEKNPDKSIRALSREPLSEVLFFWKETGRPKNKYKYYSQGILDAVSNGRYPCVLLSFIEDFPEFYPAVRDGLAKYWLTLRFSLMQKDDSTGPSLFIDSASGEDITLSDEDKLNILQIIGRKYSFPFIIDEKECLVGIFPSKLSEALSQKFHWLQSLTYNAEIK